MKIFHARKQGNEKKKTKRYYLSRKLVYGNFGPKIETGCMDEKRGWIWVVNGGAPLATKGGVIETGIAWPATKPVNESQSITSKD